MASRFWVGGTGTWDASDTTHWASSSGGAGGQSVPGSADTVTLDASSGGGTVTLAYRPNVVSITMGAFTGTFDDGNYGADLVTFSSSGTGTRTITIGNTDWTLSGNSATIWNTSNTTNLTVNVGTAYIDCTYSGSSGTRVVNQASMSEGSTFSFKFSAGSDTIDLSTASYIAFHENVCEAVVEIRNIKC